MPFYANARAFLLAVESTYRALDHYTDEGCVRPVNGSASVCSFRTACQRPGLFRFEFSLPHPYPPLRHLHTDTVIGSDGDAPYFHTRWNEGNESMERPESLGLAIAGATGISRGAAHTIGALLFAETGGFTLRELRRLRFRRTRVIDGVPCIAVSGLHPFGDRYTAWFGAQDLLLRRLLRTRSEERRWHIRTDRAEPDAFFRAPTLAHPARPS